MAQLQEGWKVEGVFNDACASEGVCPYYLGRDVQNGCRYFWVFRIWNGKVNGVDLGNTTIMYIGDIKHSSLLYCAPCDDTASTSPESNEPTVYLQRCPDSAR